MSLRTAPAAVLVLLFGCSRSNNLLLGRVQATVGTHAVVVTDCYRTEARNPKSWPMKAAGQSTGTCRAGMPTSGFAAVN